MCRGLRDSQATLRPPLKSAKDRPILRSSGAQLVRTLIRPSPPVPSVRRWRPREKAARGVVLPCLGQRPRPSARRVRSAAAVPVCSRSREQRWRLPPRQCKWSAAARRSSTTGLGSSCRSHLERRRRGRLSPRGTVQGIVVALAVAVAGTWARGRTVTRIREVERGWAPVERRDVADRAGDEPGARMSPAPNARRRRLPVSISRAARPP